MANFSTLDAVQKEREKLYAAVTKLIEDGAPPDRFFPDPSAAVRLLQDAESNLREQQHAIIADAVKKGIL